jgi:hypothetical protein
MPKRQWVLNKEDLVKAVAEYVSKTLNPTEGPTPVQVYFTVTPSTDALDRPTGGHDITATVQETSV